MARSASRSRSGAAQTRHSQAAALIGQRIVAGEWAVGMALPTEADLSRELDVSRASLREAIKLLAGKGLLSSTPRRGTIVQPHANWNRLDVDVLVWQTSGGATKSFVKDLFELRRMIEPEAAALAALRATPEQRASIAETFEAMANAEDIQLSIDADLAFHRAIVRATNNVLLAAFQPAIEASLAVSFKVSRAGNVLLPYTVPMHRAVAEPILAGDADGARKAMLALLDRSETDAESAAVEDKN
ncbi:FadR/GntR family transcriptional regulator [Labrys neptuniae]|jgi:DNA-binding FadR family transcriptional regulator|uniref:FadR/GntR family transcriptional regulator n=1 Tax=Labrys TaxID=204476 RepID=UPI0009EEACD8|nr:MULTISPECIES: FadR/GntR family transcriptional regulator [Labrys]MDT3377942.1 FadR/GntR family transcriptional regulator [Labrys neptuniae]